jgi:hypothetical protein
MEIARYWLVLSSSTGPIWDRAGAPAFGAATYVTYQLCTKRAGIAILHFDSIWAEKKLFSDWLPEFLHHLCVDLFECSICLACAFLDAQDTKRGLFEVPTPTYILHLLATRCIAAPTQCGASATPPPDSDLIFACITWAPNISSWLALMWSCLSDWYFPDSHSRDFVFDIPANAKNWVWMMDPLSPEFWGP